MLKINRILVAVDGSEGSDRAIDYAARRAKDDSAELLIVNIIGGYGLPEKVFMAFTGDQHAWLKELLDSESTQTLMAARERARHDGAGTVLLESRTEGSRRQSSASRTKRTRMPSLSANGAPAALSKRCWAVRRRSSRLFRLCR